MCLIEIRLPHSFMFRQINKITFLNYLLHCKYLFLIGAVFFFNSYIVGQSTNSWNGSTSSSWTNGSNWSLGIPSSSDNVVIPNVTNQPIVTSNVEINSITIQTSASITISSNTFTVAGNSIIDGFLNIDLGNFEEKNLLHS